MASADLTRINSNIAAMNTLNALRDVNKNLALHQQRLSTGKRINSAADDPAGLTLATKMNNRSQYLQQAMDNIGDSQNLLSVAEGGLKKINEIVTKMRVKSEAAVSDTLGSAERTAISDSLKQYAAEIDDIVNQTTWNGNKLLDGLNSFTGKQIVMQTGAQAGETTSLTDASFGSASTTTIMASHVAGGVASATKANYQESAATGLTLASFTTANAAVSSGFQEFASGTYKVRLNITDNTSATGGTLQVLDSNGNALQINDGSGNMVLSRTIDMNADLGAPIDTGRGFTIDLDPSTASGNGVATVDVSYLRATSTYTFDVSNATNAGGVVTDLDAATSAISTRLQTVGSLMDRLNFKSDALSTSQVNTDAAYSRIMDADMASEQLQATKYSILQSTATTMLAQANTAPQSIMKLFQ